MMRWIWQAAVAICVAGAPSAAAGPTVLETRHLGAWELTAAASPDGSRITCEISRASDDRDSRFGVWVDKEYGWRLWIDDPVRALGQGGTYDVTYRIDDGKPVPARAIPASRTFVDLLVRGRNGNYGAIAPLRRGHVIAFAMQQGTFTFDLTGSARATDSLRDCVRRWLGWQEDASTDPFSAEPSSPPVELAPQPGNYKPLSPGREALLVGTMILGEADIHDATDDLDAIRADKDARWTLPGGVMAVLTVQPDLQPEQSEPAIAAYVKTLAEACPADLLQISRPSDVKPPIVARLRATCGPDHSAGFSMLLRRPMGGTYLWAMLGGPGPAAAKRAADLDDRIAAAVTTHRWLSDPVQNDGDSNPFSSSLRSQPEPAPSGGADGSDRVEAVIAMMRTLRLARVIFSHDPQAEAGIRARLESLAESSSDAEWAQRYPGEITAFLRPYVDRAMMTAPDDALVALVRGEADQLNALRQRPGDCVGYFRAQSGADIANLPADLRTDFAERYADFMAAALERTAAPPIRIDEQEVGALVTKGYRQAGFPIDDLSRLDAPGIDDAETCRLANEFMAAVTSLTDRELAALYRGLSVVAVREP